MRRNSHLFSWPGEKPIVFWASLFGSGFTTAWPLGYLVLSDDRIHYIQESGLLAGLAVSGLHDVGKVAQRIHRTFETEPMELDVITDGRLLP
jgi:hypothetical protein